MLISMIFANKSFQAIHGLGNGVPGLVKRN